MLFVIERVFVWAAWYDEELELETDILGYTDEHDKAYRFAADQYEELCSAGLEDYDHIEEQDFEDWDRILEIQNPKARYKAMHKFRDIIWNNDIWDNELEENRERGMHGYYIYVERSVKIR